MTWKWRKSSCQSPLHRTLVNTDQLSTASDINSGLQNHHYVVFLMTTSDLTCSYLGGISLCKLKFISFDNNKSWISRLNLDQYWPSLMKINLANICPRTKNSHFFGKIYSPLHPQQMKDWNYEVISVSLDIYF